MKQSSLEQPQTPDTPEADYDGGSTSSALYKAFSSLLELIKEIRDSI